MFKVGDWIIDNATKKVFRLTMQFAQPFEKYLPETCELWRPKVGKWYWFGFTNQWHPQNEYTFGKLISFDGEYYTIETIHSQLEIDCWDYCEPFIGELPSFIQE